MDKVMYEVWGEDTFARENYLVGTYETRENANKALKASKRSVLGQCEELRDTFWIVELTPERKKEREDWERKQEERHRKDYSHLCELVAKLNGRLLDIVEQDREGKITEKEVKLLETNENVGDCYGSLSLQYKRDVKNGKCCLVFIEIDFKDEGRMLSSCFVGSPEQIISQFSFKEGEKFVCEIIDEMIIDFFR